MNLLTTFIFLLDLWRPAFCKEQAFTRAKEHAIASLCAFGRKTITNFAIFLGRDEFCIAADYKLYSEYKWTSNDLFNPILNEAIKHSNGGYVVVAADDTRLHKTGKKIPHTSWTRDPMSPHFHTNLIWGLRFLQMSILLPLYKENNIAARAVPIRFIDAPSIKKPGKRATQEERNTYKKAIKINNLSTIFTKNVKDLRENLDKSGHENKILLLSVDGSFCNKTCFQITIPRIHLVARCRKNIKLCFKSQEGGRRFYEEKKFTPEEIRQEKSITWQSTSIFYGGEYREIKYKEINKVLWQGGAKRKELRLIVLAPLPYIKGGRRNYRGPAFLLCTDTEGSLEEIIQAYFDRLQIEYNHRDEKSILGVGEAQVRNEKSVSKQPALQVASYSALLLSSIIAYKDQYHEDFGSTPAWRPSPKRNSCRALVGNLRKCLLERPEQIIQLGLTPPMITAILSKAA